MAEVARLKKKKKITEDQYLMLRSDQTAFNILTSKTYGDSRQFSSDLPFEILEQIKADMLKQAENKIRGKIIKTEEELAKEKNLKSQEIEEHAITKKALKGAIFNARTRDEVLKRRALLGSKIIVYSGMVITTGILIYLMYLQAIMKNWNLISIVVVIVLSVIGIANWVLGFYFLNYAKNLVPILQNKIYNWITKDTF